jgi:hypothetical protein
MPVDTFRIDLPTSWTEVPADPDEYRRTVMGAIDESEWNALPTIERRRLELFLERSISDLRASEARFAASFIEFIEPSADGEGGVLVAGVVASVLTQEMVGSPVPLTAEVVVTAMSRTDPEPDRWTRSRSTNLEPPSVVDLPGGRAVRIPRLVERGDAATKSEFFSESFFFTTPDEFRQLIVVQFATPNVENAREFSELFGVIASFVRVYHEGEPTSL